MAGSPGGASIDKVSVKVVPDTSTFADDLRADLERISKDLSISVKVTPDLSSIRDDSIRAELARALSPVEPSIKPNIDDASVTKAKVELDGLFSGVGSNALGLAKGVGLLNVLNPAPLLNTVAAAGQFTGAVAALLPAAGATAVALGGSLVAGLQGVKTAMDATTPKAYDAALKDLAPDAAATVKQLKAFAPALKDLEKADQGALFNGLDTELKRLGTAELPLVKTGLVGAASATNSFVRGITSYLASGPALAKQSTLWTNVDATLGTLAPLGRDFSSVLLDIATTGSSFLPGLAKDLADIGDTISNKINKAASDGSLNSFIQTGLNDGKKLFDVLGNVGSSVVAIFQAAHTTGGSFLDSLVTDSKKLSDYLHSSAGQAFVVSAFTTIKSAAHDAAVDLKNFVAPIADLIKKDPQLAGQLLGIAGALKLVGGNGNIASSALSGVVKGAASALAAGAIGGGGVGLLGSAGILGLIGLGTAGATLEFAKTPMGQQAVHDIRSFFAGGLDVLKGDSTGFNDQIQGLLSQSNVIAGHAIAAQIPGVVGEIGSAFQKAAPSLYDDFRGVGTNAANLFSDALAPLPNQTNAVIGKAGLAIAGSAPSLWAQFSGAGAGAANSFVGSIGGAVGGTRSVVQEIADAASGGLSGLGLIGKIAGDALTSGLAGALQSGENLVGKIASGITQTLKNNKGPLSKDRVLWTPAAHAILGSLLGPLNDGLPSVASTAQAVTRSLAIAPPNTRSALSYSAPRGAAGADRPNVTQNITTSDPNAAALASVRMLDWAVRVAA